MDSMAAIVKILELGVVSQVPLRRAQFVFLQGKCATNIHTHSHIQTLSNV